MSDYKIYPKQFRTAIIPIEKNTCFMLMPFKKEFDSIYGVIKNDLNDIGIICNRADEISGSKPIINKILTEILKSQYIIVDLTGCNPNVFYELGISHVFKDAQHILLIKQKELQIPFDISHLTYIEYDKRNLKYLTSTIRAFLEESKYISDFHEVLNIKGIVDVVHENKNEFIDYIQGYFGKNTSSIVEILNFSHNMFSENDIERILYKYTSMINQILSEKALGLLPGVLKVYYEILVSCAQFSITDVFVTDFLGDFLNASSLTEIDILSHKADMAVAFASRKKKLNVVMPWIISYFSKSKTRTIDLNRYKIESFLMTTPYTEINQIIACAVFDQNSHVREHMADIIGEKRLHEAKDNMLKQLKSEENVFSAASLISAIGKLGDPEGISHISEWIEEHEKEIIETKQFFTMKHAMNSIMKLDKISIYSKEFKEKYSTYLQNYFTL